MTLSSPERGVCKSRIALLAPVRCTRYDLPGVVMRSYFAVQGKRAYAGGWYAILAWAGEQIKRDPVPVKIVRARPGEREGRIVAEVTRDGVRAIKQGRQISIRSLNGKA